MDRSDRPACATLTVTTAPSTTWCFRRTLGSGERQRRCAVNLDVKTGERLDTLGQPESEQCTVAFTPDDRAVVAGGADRQLRPGSSFLGAAEINPLKISRTAHDSSIVKLAFSPNGSSW